MKQLFQLVGGAADGHSGLMSDLGDNQPNVIMAYAPKNLDPEIYSYASAKEETRDGERVNVRFYRLAHVVEIDI